MRVAIAGPGGSGKTTLSAAVAEHAGLPLVSEFAREALRKYGFSGLATELPADVQQAVQWAILESKLAAESEAAGYVSDCSVVDCAAIWLLRLAGRAAEHDTLAFLARCRDHARSYDRVFVLQAAAVPPRAGFPLEADGTRDPHPSLGLLHEACLLGLLERWRIPHTVIPPASCALRIVLNSL